MSLCDRCYAPGACCKRMYLTSRDGGEAPRSRLDQGPRMIRRALRRQELPFEPIERAELLTDPDGQQFETWVYRCRALQDDGRCGIYDRRPQLCRDYPAGGDRMCVHHGGAEGVDLSAGAP